MTRPQVMQLGPFTGGMNTASDPSIIEDSELADCVNLDFDVDGSLTSRPPIVEEQTTANGKMVAIGYATLGATKYVIFSSPTGGVVAWNGSSFVTLNSTVQSRVAIQYQDLVFVVATPGSTGNGGFWDGTTWTFDANMPRGEGAVFYKSRMFVTPGVAQTGVAAYQLKFTNPIPVGAPTPLNWNVGVNLISVGQGDSQKLIDIAIYQDNLVLFKKNSTWVFAYDINITEGLLRVVNTEIGCTTRFCIQPYENSIFVYHEGIVYEMLNHDFIRVNRKVPFVYDASVFGGGTRSEDVSLSMVGDRLIVRYYNRIYVFQPKTKTWSRWESANSKLHNVGRFVLFPSDATSGAAPLYLAGSVVDGTANDSMYSITDDFTSGIKEKHIVTGSPVYVDIEHTVQTKLFNFNNPLQYKKLLWWGASAITGRTVVGTVTLRHSILMTAWADLASTAWNGLAAYMWGNLFNTTSTPISTIAVNEDFSRLFFKFQKSLRFKQIDFTLKLLSDGSSAQGPVKVLTITAIVGMKQLFNKAAN